LKTLVIGDLHFDTKPVGLLQAQINAVKQIIWAYKDKVENIVFLGDLTMHRRPYPSVLLGLQEVLYEIPISINTYILRGNHDSENKNDDGKTALSLFTQNHINVVTETRSSLDRKLWLIPHYEDEERIIKDLERAPKGAFVFGHFGYDGCLNSAGDSDFSLSVNSFSNPTILGHIHRFNFRRSEKGCELVTLGTPYTTSFTESGKDNFVAIIDGDDISFEEVDFGPRHLVMNIEDVQRNLEFINDPRYYTMLRVMLNSLETDQKTVKEFLEGVNVGYVETKYRKIYHEEYDVGTFDTEDTVLEVTDDIIEEYIHSSSTEIPKQELLNGLKLIYENQKNRDQ